MPASVKLQGEYGDDLAVLFVESQGTAPAATEKFILERGWFGNPAMWTNERPFDSGLRGLPSFALLSAEGKLLVTGRHVGKDVKRLIEEEIKNANAAPEGTPKKLQKAWKTFASGKVAKGIEAARKVGSKPELAEDTEQLVAEMVRRSNRRLDRIEWLVENGFADRAHERLKGLRKELKDAGELEGRALAIEARFAESEIERELEAAEALERVLARLYEEGGDERLFDKVEKIAREYEGTKVAERARHVASLAG